MSVEKVYRMHHLLVHAQKPFLSGYGVFYLDNMLEFLDLLVENVLAEELSLEIIQSFLFLGLQFVFFCPY